MKILVFKLGAIGDVLMTTPFLRQLKKTYFGAEIIYYVGKSAAPVLEGNKNIDRIETFDETMFFRKDLAAAEKLRRKIKKEEFKRVFILDKHSIFGLFMKLCGIKVRIGFSRDNNKHLTHNVHYRRADHEIVYYLSLINAIFPDFDNYADTHLDLTLSKKDVTFADNFFKKNKLKKVIGIAVGGGKNSGEQIPIRRYPSDKMIELIRELVEKNKVLLLGGESDRQLNEDLCTFIKNKNIINGANKDIKKSAALMKKCSCIICSDSGPMHIASAVNDKVISLFGPTNPKRKAPLNKGSVAIWKDQDIYEEDYELRGKIPDKSKEDKWMRRITTKEILNEIS